jgi:hypothetical protein
MNKVMIIIADVATFRDLNTLIVVVTVNTPS